MHNFDGTNPLLEALGDEPEIKEITLTNSSAFIIVEPLTQVRLLPFEKTVIQVTGNAAYEQIMANINQLNALKSDVISIETSEPENGLPWITSPTQAVRVDVTLPEGIYELPVGSNVHVIYTNDSTEDYNAKLGFLINGFWVTETVRVVAGGGTWDFVIPPHENYPAGNTSVDLMIGGKDTPLLWKLADLTIQGPPLPFATTNITTRIADISGSENFIAAKVGDNVLCYVNEGITKSSRLRAALRQQNSDLSQWNWETVTHEAMYGAFNIVVPEPEAFGLAKTELVIAGENYQILATYPISVMNADVDESTLVMELAGAPTLPNTPDFVIASSFMDWVYLEANLPGGRPVSSLTNGEAIPRSIDYQVTPSGGVEFRKSGNGIEIRLVDGLALVNHKTIQIKAVEYSTGKEFFNASRTLYVMPETMNIRTYNDADNEWHLFTNTTAETPLETLIDATGIMIGAVNTPMGWGSALAPTFEIIGSTGDAVSYSAQGQTIVFEGVTDGTTVSSVTVRMCPEGLAGFNEVIQTLHYRRLANEPNAEEHIVTVEQVELQHNMLKFKVALTNGPEWLNGWYFQRPLGSNDEYLRLSFMNRNDGNQIYGTALNPEDTVEQYEVYFEVIYNDVTYKSPIMTAINPPAE